MHGRRGPAFWCLAAFFAATSSAAALASIAVTRARGRSRAIASAIAPVPVPRSSTRASDAAPIRISASSTSSSVSGRGTSVSAVTIRSSDQNPRCPRICAIGSPSRRRRNRARKRSRCSGSSSSSPCANSQARPRPSASAISISASARADSPGNEAPASRRAAATVLIGRTATGPLRRCWRRRIRQGKTNRTGAGTGTCNAPGNSRSNTRPAPSSGKPNHRLSEPRTLLRGTVLSTARRNGRRTTD